MRFCFNLTKESIEKMLQRKLLIKPCFKKLLQGLRKLLQGLRKLLQGLKKIKQRISFAKTLFKSGERKPQQNVAAQALDKVLL